MVSTEVINRSQNTLLFDVLKVRFNNIRRPVIIRNIWAYNPILLNKTIEKFSIVSDTLSVISVTIRKLKKAWIR
jgi:hypothetical protein